MEGIYIKRRKLKLWIRVLLMIIILVIFSQGIIMILKGITKDKTNKTIYSYDINQDVNYNIDIYNNNLFETENLGMDQTYVSNIVKSINTNFKYKYKNNKKIPLNYEYSITATINGEYTLPDEDEKSQLWTKKYNLIDTVKKETTNNSFQIDENIKIDYPKYNEVVDKFKNEIKLPITAYLSVYFEVKVSGVVDHKSVGDKQNIKLKIPLNQQAFKISKDYNKNVEKEIKKLTDKDLEIEMKKEICGTILIVVAISLFIVLYKDIFDIAKKNYYNTTLDKLLKDYGDVIVELNSEINKDGLQVVEVKNFNEMLDLEEELKIPIMFYEIEEDELGEFTINHNNIIYRYILKDEER
ncbi:MAG: DUF5305 family protein [Bacilli bacterium]